MAKFLIDENMGNKLSDSLDLYNNIKDINIQETTKVKSSSSFSTPISEQNIGRNLEIFQFIKYTETNNSEQILTNSCDIQSIQTQEAYTNVPILGLGLGHLKGCYITFKSNDLVVVGWIDKNSPVILGGINDNFSSNPDDIPQLEEGEMLISSNTAGSYFYICKDGTIKLKNSGAYINIGNDYIELTTEKGAIINLKTNGNILLKNSNGDYIDISSYGIKIINLSGSYIEIDGEDIFIESSSGSYAELNANGFKANDYYSSSNHKGITTTTTIDGTTLTFEDGLLISVT